MHINYADYSTSHHTKANYRWHDDFYSTVRLAWLTVPTNALFDISRGKITGTIKIWLSKTLGNAIQYSAHLLVHVYWVLLSCELLESWWKAEKYDQAPVCRQISGSCQYPLDLSLHDRELSVHLYVTFSSLCSQPIVNHINKDRSIHHSALVAEPLQVIIQWERCWIRQWHSQTSCVRCVRTPCQGNM